MSKLIKGTAVAVLFLTAPLSAIAQEQAVEQSEVCTASVSAVPAGTLVEAWAMFAAPFGDVVSIEVPEESGLVLATAEDVESVEMAAEEQSEEKVALANDPNTSIFWLDTRHATVGTYAITLKNEAASCAAELTVEEPTNP